MKQLILLPNEMFDDGSFECYNFALVGRDILIEVSYDHELVQLTKGLILEAMKNGKSHIQFSIEYSGAQILEIQWG